MTDGVILIAACARRHPKVPTEHERAVVWVINERPHNGAYRVVIDVDGTSYWPGHERIVYADSVELLSPERYPPQRRPQRTCPHCGHIVGHWRSNRHDCRWLSTNRQTMQKRLREVATVVLLCAALVRLDVIVPRSLWEATAWKILRPADAAAPLYAGCGAAVVGKPSSGNQNEGIWYITLEGSQASLDCAETILDNAQERQ